MPYAGKSAGGLLTPARSPAPACGVEGRSVASGSVLEVDRERVLAFRLAGHHLARRLGPRSIVKAATCGIQETPMGTAGVAVQARVEGLRPAVLERASDEHRSLVTIWSVRGAPYMVPAADLGAFTVGALPLDAASFRHSMGGWSDALEEAGLDVRATLEEMVAAAVQLLDGRTMNVNDLRDQIRTRVRSLSKVRRPDFTRDDMPEPLFRAVGTAGAVCIVAGRGTDAELARTDQWLKAAPPSADRGEARAELARRFLHGYGPATAQHFADWTQRSLADAKAALSSIEDELEEVRFAGTKRWLLHRDAKALSSPPEPRGVRLLPPQDPYLQQRDRATVLPAETSRRKLWQPTRGPGGVLVDGEIVGAWRSRLKGSRLEVTVDPFARLSRTVRDAVTAEAEQVAPFRGCETAGVSFAG